MLRPVVLHFHLFKNAGTSVDRILKQNFKDAWAEIEGPNRKKLDSDDLLAFIRSNPKLRAVSSHTAVITLPKVDDIVFIPICFVRHPIDRIRSAYEFERTQNAQTPGAIQAKKGSFIDYMEWRLSNPPSWQVSNFHAQRFKDFAQFTPARNMELVTERAKHAVNAMPWLGLVEEFDRSMETFAETIRPYYSGFKTFRANDNRTTPQGSTLHDNLQLFRESIGAETYGKLEEINALDFELYDMVKKRFASEIECESVKR